MLIQLGVNGGLAKSHSVGRWIPGSTVLWNGTTYKLAGQSKFQIRFWAALLGIFGLGYGLNARTALSSGELGISVLCGLVSFSGIALSLSSPTYREHASDCAEFLNGLLGIEAGWRKDTTFQERVRPTGLAKLLILTVLFIQIVYPWLWPAVVLVSPCSPLNIFSSLIGWCGGEGEDEEGTGTGTSFGHQSVSMVTKVMTGVGAAIPHVLFWKALYSQAIMTGLHLFLGSLTQTTLLKFLSVRLNSDFPAQRKLYAACQILNRSFANYCSTAGWAFITIITAVEISTAYLVLKIVEGSSNLPLLMKLMAIGSVPSSYLLHLMVVGTAGNVHTTSVDVLAKMCQPDTLHSKLFRRQIRSAWPVKVHLGGSNFVEAGTTLVMLDFIVGRLVDLLLIGG